ncbi:MAG TPA: hypothetical protein VGN35_06275 [Jatrophihabitantaceae bacterium]|jgi:hypothetical protein|nr:hypothetical protein [Jatrophihabitantaceae bacterium]
MTVPPGAWPPPEGEPIYVAEAYPPQPLAQPYVPAVRPAVAAPRGRRTEPGYGWLLFGVGVLTAVASLLPWAVFFGVSINGTNGDGTLTVLCAVIISAVGLIIGLGQGLLWAPLTAMACAGLVTMTALVDIGSVDRFVPQAADTFSTDAVTVGPGLWLTLIGGVLGIGVAAFATLRRRAW